VKDLVLHQHPLTSAHNQSLQEIVSVTLKDGHMKMECVKSSSMEGVEEIVITSGRFHKNTLLPKIPGNSAIKFMFVLNIL